MFDGNSDLTKALPLEEFRIVDYEAAEVGQFLPLEGEKKASLWARLLQ